MTKSTYQSIALEVAATVEKKQAAYGDAHGKSGEVMRILYPQGIPPEKMGDALTVVRVLDKLFRVATDRDALGESPWRDIAGYALLSVARTEAQPTHDDRSRPMMEVKQCTRCKWEWMQEVGSRSAHQCPPFEPQT